MHISNTPVQQLWGFSSPTCGLEAIFFSLKALLLQVAASFSQPHTEGDRGDITLGLNCLANKRFVAAVFLSTHQFFSSPIFKKQEYAFKQSGGQLSEYYQVDNWRVLLIIS